MKKKDHETHNQAKGAKLKKPRAATRAASPAARDDEATAATSTTDGGHNDVADCAPLGMTPAVDARDEVRDEGRDEGRGEVRAEERRDEVPLLHVREGDASPPWLARTEAFAPERFRRALEMVLHACPRKEDDGAFVVFERDVYGVPLVAAHDRVRCHYAFLPKTAEMLLRGAVARNRVVELRNLLASAEESEGAAVRVLPSGRVEITRAGQPMLLHDLLPEPTPLGWEPPRDSFARHTVAPLALACDRLARAVRYQGATARIEQRTSARVVINLTVGDELVARAVLAENGGELYPVDAAQQPLPFREGAARRSAPVSSRTRAEEDDTAFPKATTKVVFAMASTLWRSLDDETRARASKPCGASIAWIDCGGEHATAALDEVTATALGRVLARAGLRRAEVIAAEDDSDADERTEQWQVERAALKGGA